MANIISYRGKRIVFGLDWNLLAGEKPEEIELREAAKEANAAFQVRFATQHTTIFGFLSKDDLGEKPEKADKLTQYVSASMLLATVEGIASDAIWVEVVDGLARLAVLEGGLPSPSGDFCGTPDEADGIISRLQQIEGRDFNFYGEYSEKFVDQFVPLTLENLIEGGDLEASTLQPSKKGANKNTSLFIFLGLILVAGFGFTQYQKHVEKEKLLELQRKQQQQNPNAAYKLALERALPTAGVPASNAIDIFASGWGQQEIDVAGWHLVSVECAPKNCTYKWKIAYGTNESLAKVLGKKDFKFNVNGAEIQYSVATEKSPTKNLQVDKLPTYANFMVDTGSFVQSLRMIKVASTLTEPSYFAAESGINMSAVTSPVKFGKITISAKLALLKEIITKLPDNVTFQKLAIKAESKDSTFTLEGNYYVKD